MHNGNYCRIKAHVQHCRPTRNTPNRRALVKSVEILLHSSVGKVG